eukprot:gene38594-21494_t
MPPRGAARALVLLYVAAVPRTAFAPSPPADIMPGS